MTPSRYWQLDHFSFVNNASFRQRIIVSMDHWRPQEGVIFFYTGNEGDIMQFANNTGFMWDYADDFGAMVVFAEHRYYGESLPFGQDSFKVAWRLRALESCSSRHASRSSVARQVRVPDG